MKVLHYNDTHQDFKAFKQKALAGNQAIVHIHVCWSWTAWRVMRWCRRHQKPVVLSPHRQLEPWHVLHRYWLCKLPKLLIFQRWMIRRAHAVVAVTEQEQSHLLRLSLHPRLGNAKPWNGRVVLIRDFRRTSRITETQMDEQYGALYQKVVDSHAFMTMTDEEKEVENTLLRVGLSQDEQSRSISQEQAEQVGNLSPDSWRKILLHADEEGILQDIRTGASLLQIAPQAISGIDRFAPSPVKNNQPLRADESQLKSLRLTEYAEEKRLSETEMRVCTIILNFIHELQRGSLSRRHVADLYTTLRFTDYDEHKAMQVLQLLKERKTTERLLQILHETLGLEEGFMPTEARNDRGTKALRKALRKMNIQ